MVKADIPAVKKRILKGERATLVVAPENMAAAEAMLAALPPRIRALLTLKAAE